MDNSSAAQQRFGRDVLIAGTANLVRSLRNLTLVPLITGHLSLAHYGEWDLLATAIAFLIPWVTFSLSSALIRFLPGCDDQTVRGLWPPQERGLRQHRCRALQCECHHPAGFLLQQYLGEPLERATRQET